jgi:hypothetical protein
MKKSSCFLQFCDGKAERSNVRELSNTRDTHREREREREKEKQCERDGT